jgi:plasmid stabilization system protein ParE
MTAHWTIDDLPDGLEADLRSALTMGLALDDSDAAVDHATDILNAIAPHLVADVRAARLADDMAAVIRRLTDGWAFGELFDDPVDGDNFWFKGVTPDGYEYEFEDEMSPGEVAALRHARQEDR